MKKVNMRLLGALLVALLWAGLALALWLGPRQDFSEAERRPLAQVPEFTLPEVLSGKFMGKFEDFTLDQFPLRDTFRTVKSLFHYKVLGQLDNNGIYIQDGYAAQQEYPLDESSLAHAIDRFQYLYDRYLRASGSRVFFALVPDKGQVLAPQSGNLSLDFDRMEEILREGMPWAQFVALREDLGSAEGYYRTDTHWRQEQLALEATSLCNALGVEAPDPCSWELRDLERPFYGVYYGQAALPMEPDTLTYVWTQILENCRVYDYETGEYGPVYNVEHALTARDPYDLFLSGPKSLLTIENPNGDPDRELILFRDSFGSSIAPLLVQGYSKITLVDIRYMQTAMLGNFLEFSGQDVLFLYSTLVLNNSETIK